jgi:hypothetical protein
MLKIVMNRNKIGVLKELFQEIDWNCVDMFG